MLIIIIIIVIPLFRFGAMLLLHASFPFCFPKWAEIEKKMGGKTIKSKTKLGQKVGIKVRP